MDDQFHQAHDTGAPFVVDMTEVFLKRPGMYMGLPITYERVTAFIHGYNLAIFSVRDALGEFGVNMFNPGPVDAQFQDQLRQEGRLRWNSWNLTIAAEVIGWDQEEPPNPQDLTPEQNQAAIQALRPLLDRMFTQPDVTAKMPSRNIEMPV